MNPGDERVEHEPWLAVWSPEGPGPTVQARLDELWERLGASFGERAYVAESAVVIGDELHLGGRSFIAVVHPLWLCAGLSFAPQGVHRLAPVDPATSPL